MITKFSIFLLGALFLMIFSIYFAYILNRKLIRENLSKDTLIENITKDNELYRSHRMDLHEVIFAYRKALIDNHIELPEVSHTEDRYEFFVDLCDAQYDLVRTLVKDRTIREKIIKLYEASINTNKDTLSECEITRWKRVIEALDRDIQEKSAKINESMSSFCEAIPLPRLPKETEANSHR